MPKKVYFKYGVMGSAKSLDLVRAEYNYRERGMDTIVFMPEMDTRTSKKVWSRVGVSVNALPVSSRENLFVLVKKEIEENKRHVKAVFVDEVNFMTAVQIDQLADVADYLNIPVLCYGLRTDFRTQLFEGSRRLLEIADEIEEIKAMCECGRKAICTARFVDGKPVNSGEQIVIGVEQYNSYCRSCYKKLFKSQGDLLFDF